jgi:hypothetical protein
MSALCQKATSGRLLDDLVGEREHPVRNCKAKEIRGSTIYHSLKLGRLFDWNITGLSAPQNLIDVVAWTPERVRENWTIRHQRPRSHELANGADHRQLPIRGRRNDLGVVNKGQRVTHNKYRLNTVFESLLPWCNVLRSPNFCGEYFDAQ